MGEEHVEVAEEEEGNGGRGSGSGRGDSALGDCISNGCGGRPSPEGLNGDFLVVAAMPRWRSCNAATTLQCCNGGAAGLLKSK